MLIGIVFAKIFFEVNFIYFASFKIPDLGDVVLMVRVIFQLYHCYEALHVLSVVLRIDLVKTSLSTLLN